MVRWPSEFPHPVIKPYGYATGDTNVRTKMEAGNTVVRRRFSSAPTVVKVQWIMEPRVFQVFKTWFTHRTMSGAEWFLMDLMSDTGEIEQTVRFIKSYKAKLVSNEIWTVNAELEVREFVGMPEDALGQLEGNLDRYFAGESLDDIVGDSSDAE